MSHKIFVRSHKLEKDLIEHEFLEKHDAKREIPLVKAFSFHKNNKEEASEILRKYETGIYILRGPQGDKTFLYVGKGNIIKRLKADHDKEESKHYKPWWKDAIFFTEADTTVLSSCAANFEYKLYNAIRNENCEPTNLCSVSNPPIRPADQEEVNFLSESIFLGLEIIGWPYFSTKSVAAVTSVRPSIQQTPVAIKLFDAKAFNDPSRTYVLRQKNITSFGRYAPDGVGFVVLQNSEASMSAAPSFNEYNDKKNQMIGYAKKHKELVDNKTLIPNQENNKFVFTSDYHFNNANEAACVVVAGSIAGKRYWIDEKENVSILDIESRAK